MCGWYLRPMCTPKAFLCSCVCASMAWAFAGVLQKVHACKKEVVDPVRKSPSSEPATRGRASTWWAKCDLLWWTLLLHQVFKCHGMFYNIFDSCMKICVCLYVCMLVNLFGCNPAETLSKLAPRLTLVFMVSPLLLPPKSLWWYCGHVCWFASFGPTEQKLLNLDWVGSEN